MIAIRGIEFGSLRNGDEDSQGNGIIPAMSGKSLFNQPHSEHTNLPSRIKYKEKEIPGLIFP